MNYSINRRFIVRFTVGIVVAALSAAAIVGLSGGSDHRKSSSQLRRDNRSVTATKEKAQAPTLDPTTAIAEVNEEKSSTVAAQASDGSSAKAPAAPAAAVAPVAPPAAVAPVAPPAAVAPVGDHTGPTFGGVGAGCGVKTIFSITVSDPSGVAAVWGNYYNDAGVKTGFTMGPGQNGYWVVSIFDTDLDGFDSIYVAASDSAGNTSSTRVSGLCQV